MVALVWLATVAGVSTLTWSVISAAGLQVGAQVVVPNPTPANPSAPPSPEPTRAAQSWNGIGGRLTVRCAGDAIELSSAVPDVGYKVEVKDKGPIRLQVHFEATGSGPETKLVAVCSGGAAQFRQE